MSTRLLGMLIGLALVGPTDARMTNGCRGYDSTLCLIDGRIAAFRDAVWQAHDSLGPIDGFVGVRLQRSARCFTRATALCDGRIATDADRARRKLRECVRPLVAVQAKLRSRRARRAIAPALVATVAAGARGLARDLEAARASLTCPPPGS